MTIETTMDLTKEEIAKRVRPYLAGRNAAGVTLTVDENRIHRNNGYWRVPVRPSHWPEPLFPFFEVLAHIEDEVTTKEGLNVIISSGEPTDEE